VWAGRPAGWVTRESEVGRLRGLSIRYQERREQLPLRPISGSSDDEREVAEIAA
jgi:hypothetical protein